MTGMILLLISVALVNNVVLSQFLGLCPFLGVSKKIETAAGMGGAVIFVMSIASIATSLVYKILVLFHLEYLNTVTFILVIAALVQLVEMFLKKYSSGLYSSLGVYLPLITTNCAVLGVAITNVQNNYDILTSLVCSFGTAVGLFSYTHLTLPTIYSVSISVVAVSLKKKKKSQTTLGNTSYHKHCSNKN